VLTGVRGGQVLDLCCGPGRHAVALAKRGFAVTAVDRTRVLLKHARARAPFGYFEDQADDLRVLELIRENLRPSGVFVLEMVSKERLAR
jgi:ubiquinone/menaquinone biosynthesis C-methylase UbiE